MCQNEVRDAFRVRYKWTVLEYAKVCRTGAKAYSEFGVPKSTFHDWKKVYDREGKLGLSRKKPIAKNHPRSLSQDVVDKILELRKTYKLGPERITRNNMRRLPKNSLRRAIHTRRYPKEMPGHHIQVDVKFVSLINPEG